MNDQHVFGQLELERLDGALTLIRDVFCEYETPEYSDAGVEDIYALPYAGKLQGYDKTG